MSSPDLSKSLHAIAGMEVSALLQEWKRLFRRPPPERISRSLLELGIAWKLQEATLGGLSRATIRRLTGKPGSDEGAGPNLEPRSITLKPGSRLVREWRGEIYDVLVVDGGYEWRGQRWISLSVIAREITGTRWSGPRFFGLEKPRAKRPAGRAEVTDV
ncbi:DUF2924 domain-containing protein [Thalassobaculum sp.]|uniref:DUF2924 domain-containing protein n=1 Tax=Thalassobaculum sp. TaxID=2022740 RepID=UPI0032EBB287